MSTDTPLGEGAAPLSTGEVSWIGAIPALSLLVGSPLFGFIVQKLGRKLTYLLALLPNVMSFGVLLFANNVYIIYIARVMAGFAAAGTFIVTPIYVNEITTPALRGVLCSVSGLFINMGVIMAFILGGYTSYVVMNASCLCFASFPLFFFFWMPESPVYLLSKNKKKAAIVALKKLQGGRDDEIEKEVDDMHRVIQENAKLDSKKMSLRSLIRDRPSRLALCIVIGVMTTQQMSGISAVVGYAVSIFEASGSALPPVLAAVWTSILQLCGSAFGAFLVTRAGRKTLLMTSTVMMAISLAMLSVFVMARTNYSLEILDNLGWVPPCGLMIYIIAYSIGFGTVPFILLPELFRPEARGLAGAIVNSWISILNFFIVKFFPILTEYISLSGSFAVFSVMTALGASFIYFVLFETKGKTLEEILWILKKKTDYSHLAKRAESNLDAKREMI